jgi:glycosyltransferase involved in cell wall biosynthesis
MQMLLSVVVPCYNEEKNIAGIVATFRDLIMQNPFLQVVLVNNGSTDNSKTVFREQLQHPGSGNFKLVELPVNKGYGYGILEGLAQADAAIRCWTHADQQTDPGDTIKAYHIYRAANNENLLVKGRRINRNPLDRFFSWGMELYAGYKLKTKLKDINAQPKLFSCHFYRNIKDSAPHDFSLDLYFLYAAQKNGSIVSFDVQYKKRLFGEAKGGGSCKGKWKLIKRSFYYINQLAKRKDTECTNS